MEKLAWSRTAKFGVFDFETEHLRLYDNKPWQIAWGVWQNDKCLYQHQRYIWWKDLKVSKEAAFHTRFDYNVYKANAVPREEVWEEIEPFIYDKSIWKCGHNILGFDSFIIKVLALSLGKWRGFEGFINEMIDTNCLAKAKKQNITIERESLLSFQLKVSGKPPRGIKTSLGFLCKEEGIEYDASRAHEALYDINCNQKVLKSYLHKCDL